MAHYTLIGGHGKVALRLSRILCDYGDSVSSIIRNPDHAADVEATGAQPVVLDVEQADVAALAAEFGSSEAIIWSAGAGGGNPDRTYAVDRDAAIRAMQAAAAAEVKRFVMVSYDGAGPDHGVDPDSSFFPYAEAKAAADAYLRESDLEWTIVGPGKLTDEPGSGTIGIGEDKRQDRHTSRDNVAAVVSAVLHRPDAVGRQIEFSDGPTPIGEAITRQ